jgi:uncharacterized FAD-dependent dehydrogenase
MTNNMCDILIIGGGPAGLAIAHEISRNCNASILILDQGCSINERYCPMMRKKVCLNCDPCNLLSGIGGASGVNGGKLCFFPSGERLAQHCGFSNEEANRLVYDFIERNHSSRIIPKDKEFKKIYSRQMIGKLSYKPYAAFPILGYSLRDFFVSLNNIIKTMGVKIKTNSKVIDISCITGDYRFQVVYEHDGRQSTLLVTSYVILATGRSGSGFTEKIFSNMDIRKDNDFVDIGARIYIPNSKIKQPLPFSHDPKLIINKDSENEVRTLCWCFGGELTITNPFTLELVDGHFGEELNDSLSVSIVNRVPLDGGVNPLAYVKEIMGYTAKNNQPVVQDLKDFLNLSSNNYTNSSNYLPIPCKRGNISKIFSPSLINNLKNMIEHVDKEYCRSILSSKNGLILAPVVDKFWTTPNLDDQLMTNIPNLYIAGDATGLGRGIIQSLFSGIIIARSIVYKIRNPIENEYFQFSEKL